MAGTDTCRLAWVNGTAELVLEAEKLTVPDITKLTETIGSLATQTRALVMRSAGPNFCLGRATPEASGRPPSANDVRATVIDPILELYATVTCSPFPVIAAVRGCAAGLGFALAGCCDAILATEDAIFQLPEIGAGFAPLLAMSQLAQLIPRQLLFHLASTASPIGARRLWEGGMVTALIEDEELDASARSLAAELALHPSVRDVKAFQAQHDKSNRRADERYAADHLESALSPR